MYLFFTSAKRGIGLDLLAGWAHHNSMKLVDVRPKENFRLFVRYDDGVSGDVDLSAYLGKGVFRAWEEPGLFAKVRLAAAGHPEWPGGIDLCPDALYMQLTGKRPEEVFPTLKRLSAHA